MSKADKLRAEYQRLASIATEAIDKRDAALTKYLWEIAEYKQGDTIEWIVGSQRRKGRVIGVRRWMGIVEYQVVRVLKDGRDGGKQWVWRGILK